MKEGQMSESRKEVRVPDGKRICYELVGGVKHPWKVTRFSSLDGKVMGVETIEWYGGRGVEKYSLLSQRRAELSARAQNHQVFANGNPYFYIATAVE
jgi:hypothetical protein